MIEADATLMSLMKFVFSFFLLLVFLPSLVLRDDGENRGMLDKLFISLIHSCVFFILAVHVLVLLRLYEPLSLYFVTAMTMVWMGRYNAKADKLPVGMRMMIRLFDLSENRESWKLKLHQLKDGLTRWLAEKCQAVISTLKQSPVLWFGIILTFGFAAYVRFHHSLTHLYFGAADPYVHLKWMKMLGINGIYVDGVYTYGFEAVLSALSRFFLLDPYAVLRFVGPVSGLLVVLSLFYTVKKLGGDNLTAAFLATVFYAAFSVLPSYVWRQISALPMEFAAVFLLPGIMFWWQYFRLGNKVYLFLAAECLLLITLIHPFTAFALGLAYAAVAVVYAGKWMERSFFLRSAGWIVLAGVIGLLPPFLGILMGKEFHAISLNYIKRNIQSPDASGITNRLSHLPETDPFLLIMLAAAVLAVLYSIVLRLKKDRLDADSRAGDWAVPAAVFLLFYAEYRAGDFGFPTAVPADRFGVFFALIAAWMAGVILYQLGKKIRLGRETGFVLHTFLVVSVFALVVFSPQRIAAPEGDRYQYDEAVWAYQRIKTDYPVKNWTIVSPVEEFPLVNGYGYHDNLWAFVQAISDPSHPKLSYPTDDVFLFVEKIPLGTNVEIGPGDAAKPFPQPTDGDLTEYYYRNAENRRILEAKAYVWAQAYMKKHDNMTVFYEGANMKIYRIHQDGKNPPNLLK